MRRRFAAATAAALAVVVSGCGGGAERAAEPRDDNTRPYVADAAFPSAMAPRPDGGLLYGERLTGRVRRVTADGALEPLPVAQVQVSTDGQRGLVGLAVDDGGRVFASWTDRERRLVVAQVAPGPIRPVWDGPPTTELANGGRLAFAPDEALVIGIGDLQDPALVDDPDAVNGKLLRLDADGPPSQTPAVISAGWNNPFAFTFTPTGELWVADNSPGADPERLTRGDRAGPVTELPDQTAPSGLAAPEPDELLVCGYVSGDLTRYEVRDGRAERADTVTAECQLGVTVLADGRVVVATETAILLVVD